MSTTPSYGNGFARDASNALYPGLWRGLVAGWAPILGYSGNRVSEITGNTDYDALLLEVSPPEWVGSTYGFALNLDTGTTSQFPTGTNLFDLGIRQNATWWTWARLHAGATSNNTYISDWTSNQGFALREESGGVTCYVYPANDRVTSAGTTMNDVFETIAGTMDGVTLRVYIRGREVGTANLTADIGSSINPIHLGNRGDVGGAEHLQGDIAMGLVWNRALSADELILLEVDPLAALRLRMPVHLFHAGIPVVGGTILPQMIQHLRGAA